MLKTQIKASQITNLTDARYFAAWHTDWLGFDLDPASEHYCTPTQIQALKAWVEGPKVVGEFGLQSPEEMASAVEMLDLDAIQIAPFVNPKTLQQHIQVPILKKLVWEPEMSANHLDELMTQDASKVHCFLLELDKNGLDWPTIQAGSALNVDQIHQLCQRYPILLSLNLGGDEVDAVLDQLQPLGLSLQGGAEEKVGFKSFDELDEIFEALEVLE